MKKVKCTIIQDILPLYIDEVVSTDTEEMVHEHLQTCDTCRKEYEFMKQDVYLPVQNETSMFTSINRKWKHKKWMIAGTSIALTVAVLFGAFFYVFHYDTIIPYEEDLVGIVIEDQNLQVHYYGESYYSSNGAGPTVMEIDGVEKNVMFIQYTETIANNSSSGELFAKKSSGERENVVTTIITPSELATLDAIYYTEVDFDILKPDHSWAYLLEGATLIWER